GERLQPVIESVSAARREIFLEQKLEHVGDRLQQTAGANPVRAKPVLDEGAHLALGVNRVGNHRQNNDKDDADDFQQRRDDKEGIHVAPLTYDAAFARSARRLAWIAMA